MTAQKRMQLVRKLTVLILITLVAETSFANLVEKFQLALYRHYSKGGENLYDPQKMKEFAETHARGLFDKILHSITRTDPRLSGERKSLQVQRTVALLHILSYFR